MKFNLQPISNLFQQDWLDGISDVKLNATQLTEYFEESLNVIYYCLIMIGENCILSCSTPEICRPEQTCEPVVPSEQHPLGYKCTDKTGKKQNLARQSPGNANLRLFVRCLFVRRTHLFGSESIEQAFRE